MSAPILAGRFIEKPEKNFEYRVIAKSLYDPVYKYPATDYVANIVLTSILAAFKYHDHYPVINYVTTTELSVAKHDPERIWLKNVITIKTCGYTFEIVDSKENNSLREKVDIRISRMYYAGESSKLINEIDLLFDENDVFTITEIVKVIYKKIYVSIEHKLSKDKNKTLKNLDAMQECANTMKAIKETLNGPGSEQDNESVTPKLDDTNTDNKAESLPVNNTEHY
jgi:hypothetical protein